MSKFQECFWKIYNFFHLYVYAPLFGQSRILKSYDSADMICSTRRLNPHYYGPIMRLKNPIDGSEKDIYKIWIKKYEGFIVVLMYNQSTINTQHSMAKEN